MSRVLETNLIRLQCYEGLDANHALYEWNYPRQILAIKLGEECGTDRELLGDTIFTEDFLIKRPLLEAILSSREREPVLLIERSTGRTRNWALLLEVLSDFQISTPKWARLARRRPMVILTSNRTRDIHDALKRRCLYHWIDYPDIEKERAIIEARVPGITRDLAGQVARFMARIRDQDLVKKPGLAETLDWAAALLALERTSLDEGMLTNPWPHPQSTKRTSGYFQDLWGGKFPPHASRPPQ
jgi:MoxR-like ATPase